MDRYEIYCTAGQTKKALELGAPIRTIKSIRTKDTILSDDVIEYDENTFTYVKTPTATQMIGWLLAQEDIKDIFVSLGYINWHYAILLSNGSDIGCNDSYGSHEEATLAAIDAVLDYLTKNKK